MTQMFTPQPVLYAPQFGDGAPIILLHGSASTGAHWRSMIGCLEGRFRLITPDLPGCGRSTELAPGAMSLEDVAKALTPIVDREARPVHLVGHSFGGAVALKFASLFPGKVASLTLIEPAAFNVIRHQMADTQFIWAVEASKDAMAAGDNWHAMRHFVDFWNGAGAWGRTSHRLCQVLGAQIGQVHRDFEALASDRFDEDDAAGVVCPTLIITGDASPAEMGLVRAALVEQLPFVRSEMIEGAGHMVALTDPHVVDPMVGEFVAQVEFGWQDHARAA